MGSPNFRLKEKDMTQSKEGDHSEDGGDVKLSHSCDGSSLNVQSFEVRS